MTVRRTTQNKIETYGKQKDYSARARVVLFFAALLIFAGLLAMGKSFIFDESFGAGSTEEVVTDANIEKGESMKKGSVAKPLDFDFSILETDSLIRKLPAKAAISLNVEENYFTIGKGSVVKGKSVKSDLTINIPEKYFSEISGGLCETVRKANENGDLNIETHLSKTNLMWKYRGILEYRDCLGM